MPAIGIAGAGRRRRGRHGVANLHSALARNVDLVPHLGRDHLKRVSKRQVDERDAKEDQHGLSELVRGAACSTEGLVRLGEELHDQLVRDLNKQESGVGKTAKPPVS